jgi:hypothetical protein
MSTASGPISLSDEQLTAVPTALASRWRRIRVINRIATGFENVVMTQDWHTSLASYFKERGRRPKACGCSSAISAWKMQSQRRGAGTGEEPRMELIELTELHPECSG